MLGLHIHRPNTHIPPPTPPCLNHPAGAASDLVFLSLHSWLGPACFLVFALLALAAAAYVARVGGSAGPLE